MKTSYNFFCLSVNTLLIYFVQLLYWECFACQNLKTICLQHKLNVMQFNKNFF